MANGFEFDPMRGADPTAIQRLNQAQLAQSQLGTLQESPERQMAMERSQAQMQSPNALGFLANVLQRRGGRQDLEKMKTQADALRGTIGKGVGAEADIARGEAAYQDQLKRANVEQQQQFQRDIAQEGRAFKKTFAQEKRQRLTFEDPENPGQEMNIETDGFGNYFKGGQPLDPAYVTNLQSLKEKAGLTESQKSTGLKGLGKRMQPYQTTLGKFNRVASLINPYGKGGDKEGQDIPGMGLIQGQRGVIGDVARLAGSQEGRDVNAAFNDLVNGILRANAGSAQTFTETANTLRGLGAQDIATEQDLLNALPQIQKALKQDIGNLKGTTHGDVLESFSESMGGLENTLFAEGAVSSLNFGEPEKTAPKQPAINYSADYSETDEARYQELLKKSGGG